MLNSVNRSSDVFTFSQKGTARNSDNQGSSVKSLPYFGQTSEMHSALVDSRQTGYIPHGRRGISKHVQVSGQVMLRPKEDIVKPFNELIDQVPDLETIPRRRSDAFRVSTGNPVTQSTTAEMNAVAIHKHTTDRNWVDILLFSNYYLVIIQKKQADIFANEWLNKYAKDTGKDADSWLSLPGAGKMCKVSEEGVVAVLQVGKQYRCVAIVKTSDILSHGNGDKVEVMYRINVIETYSAITCLNVSHQNIWSKQNPEMRLAAVFSAERDGIMIEGVNIFYPNIFYPETLSMKVLQGVKTYECKQTTVFNKSGLNNISALTTDRLVVTTVYSVTCITTGGDALWNLHMPKRVTDICCCGSGVFVCLPDRGQVLKIETKKDKVVMTDYNVLRGEHLNPSQLSVCGHEMLIREFIPEEYRSRITIIRI